MNFRAKMVERKLTLRCGHRYQIIGGSRKLTQEENFKRLNGQVDFVPEKGFEGKQLIPRIPVEIVAEAIWPRIRKSEGPDRLQDLKNILNIEIS